ncbi:MAG TPA: HAD-IA family hydrolase [Bryobacteraceae bacterium]|nr:HAD-IA family hydrolase [Bryobacteraceae bacterium]
MLPDIDLRFRAALFDMDGTLVDSTAIIEEEWTRWALQIGKDPDEVLKIAHGRRTEEVIQAIAPDREIEKELTHFLELAAGVDQNKVRAVEGAVQFVSLLDNAHWAVVTSAPRHIAYQRLHLAGFPEPRVLISADDVRTGKPHPEGFTSAALLLKMDLQDCLAFEDSPPGILAARAAGIRVIALKTTHAQLGFGELYQIATFADLTVIRSGSSYEAAKVADV